MAIAAPEEKIDIGRVISRGFEALRANFFPFFAFALLLSGVPSFLVQYWAMTELRGADNPGFFISAGYWGPLLGGWLLAFVAGMVLQGVLVRSTILFLSGREPDLAQSVLLALRLVIHIFVVSLIVGLLTVIGLLLLIVPGVIVYCAFIVSIPALIEERRGIFGSLQRSRDLTRGSRGRIFLLLVVLWVFSVVIGTIINAVTGVSMTNPFEMQFPDPTLAGAAAGVGGALSAVIGAVLLAALYIELRTVKEGATTDDLAAIFE